MNMNFGKLNDNQLTYSPNALELADRVILNPTAEQYLSCGWKAVNAASPAEPAPTGSHYEPDGWADDATTITRKWKVVADPVIPRKFSKLKIYAAISGLDTVNSAATWATVQTWLEGKSVNGMNGWLAFQLAQEISEDHPLFAAWSEEARQLLGLTPEQFETLLNSCILEG